MESIHLFQFSKTKANLSEEIIFQLYIVRIHEGSGLHCLDWEVLGGKKKDESVKVLFVEDKKYKRGFKYNYVWLILKDMQKFSDNDSAISTSRRPRGHNVSEQEDSPTPESPTTVSLGLSSFSLGIVSDDTEGSTSQRPIGVKKAKLKKRAAEENSTSFATFTEG